MPVLSLFIGIMIKMYHADHSPPHFHAFYGEFEAQISIASGRILRGKLPPRIKKLVNERQRMVYENRIDWAIAELLAYGTLLLEGHPISPVVTEAAKDFLEFVSDASRQHIGRCPWCLKFFIGRANKKYCKPQHGVSYNNARKVASGYSKEKMREYREKDPLKYM